jgi:hypothetical protein
VFFSLFAEVLLGTAFELFSFVFGSCLVIFPAGKEKRKGFVLYCLELAIALLKATMRKILISQCNKLEFVCCCVGRLMKL